VLRDALRCCLSTSLSASAALVEPRGLSAGELGTLELWHLSHSIGFGMSLLSSARSSLSDVIWAPATAGLRRASCRTTVIAS